MAQTAKLWKVIIVSGLVLSGAWLTVRSAAAASLQEPAEKKSQAAANAVAVTRGKRLILKDGSFHIVRSYEQKGDRVRYYSVERSAWEEIPSELVDWEATRAAESETEAKQQEMVEKMRAAEKAARAQEIDVDASIEVAPGIFLPEGEGFFVVEEKAVLPLGQVGADVKLSKGRLLAQIFTPIPVIPSKHSVQIAGKQATVRITTSQPEFYMRIADDREPEMGLIRAKVKGDSREIQVIQTVVTGEKVTEEKSLSVQRWKVARGVYRFTLSAPLEPGEYAFAEYLPGEGMNLYVWDFGVDPPPPKASKP